MGLRKRKKSEKNGHRSVQDIENNGYLRCPSRKKKRDKRIKIAPVLSQKYFQVSRERYVSRSIVELG
jgi:hypothetical protein